MNLDNLNEDKTASNNVRENDLLNFIIENGITQYMCYDEKTKKYEYCYSYKEHFNRPYLVNACFNGDIEKLLTLDVETLKQLPLCCLNIFNEEEYQNAKNWYALKPNSEICKNKFLEWDIAIKFMLSKDLEKTRALNRYYDEQTKSIKLQKELRESEREQLLNKIEEMNKGK